MLYYAAYVEKQKKEVPEPTPGLMLLDAQRLAAYSDASNQFDNRYVAVVPLADALQQRQIKNVLYIVPDRSQSTERDDLNDEFVEYKDAKINVSIFPLSELQPVTETVAKTNPDGTTERVVEQRYYYGGGFGSHLGFLMLYSFLAPRPMAYYSYGGAGGRRVTMDQTRPPRRAPNYTPRPRPTQFSSSRVGGTRGVGRMKPSGFGRTTVRTSGGKVMGLRPSGRSGSFGRGAFGFGG
jgi:hypothetical protein